MMLVILKCYYKSDSAASNVNDTIIQPKNDSTNNADSTCNIENTNNTIRVIVTTVIIAIIILGILGIVMLL